MKNLRFPALIMAALAVGFVLLLEASVHSLPERVASHFDAHGHPDGWTERTAFLWLMGGVGLLLPFLFVALILILRFAPSLRALVSGAKPLSDHAGMTFAYLLRRSFWFGCMTLCFIAAVQALIVEANAVSPPRLQTAALMVVLAGFTVGVMFWSFSLLHHLSRGRRSLPPT